jgi:hypothetical protein
MSIHNPRVRSRTSARLVVDIRRSRSFTTNVPCGVRKRVAVGVGAMGGIGGRGGVRVVVAAAGVRRVAGSSGVVGDDVAEGVGVAGSIGIGISNARVQLCLCLRKSCTSPVDKSVVTAAPNSRTVIKDNDIWLGSAPGDVAKSGMLVS